MVLNAAMQSAAEPRKNVHIEQLTWLRGIAAFLVIVSHSIRASEVKYAAADERSYFLPLSLLDLGSYAVALFFVLSGSALWLSNRRLDGFAGIGRFYAKRFFRIWPAFFVSLLVYAAFIPIFKRLFTGQMAPEIAALGNDEYTFFNAMQYLSLTFNLTGPKGLFNGAYWSLPVEFQYYLVFPVLVSSIVFIRSAGPLLIAALFYCTWHFEWVVLDRYEVLNLAYTFCGGVLLGYFYTEGRLNYRLGRRSGVLLIGLCIAVVSAIYNNFLPIPNDIPVLSRKWDWYGLLAVVTVFVAIITEFGSQNTRLTRFLTVYGEISYSTYLFHFFVIGLAVLAVVHFELYGDSLKLFFIFSFTLILSYPAALLSYRYVELPGIRFGKNLVSGRRDRNFPVDS